MNFVGEFYGFKIFTDESLVDEVTSFKDYSLFLKIITFGILRKKKIVFLEPKSELFFIENAKKIICHPKTFEAMKLGNEVVDDYGWIME